MELVIGGAFQGKLTWALRHYGLTMDDVCDLAVSEPRAGAKCYCHLEALSRREADMARYLPLFENVDVIQIGARNLPLFENAVVVCREVSGGIVPMDGGERAWRERHGTLMQELARRADHVTRVFCGLTEVLK